MRKLKRNRRGRPAALVAAWAVAALGAGLLHPAGAQAAGGAQPPEDHLAGPGADRLFSASPRLVNPLGDKQESLRQAAYRELLGGEATVRTRGGSQVVELADGEFVETATTGTDRIFTVLVEFGEQTDPQVGGTPGPLVNEIPEPDRSVDNTTIWREDFDRQYYEDVYYSEDPATPSVKQYYESQSSGRYTVEGLVTDWVKLEYNEARYGNNACGSSVCQDVWDLVRDGVNAWYEDRLAAGATPEELRATLAEYDRQDRYDYDGDGDFDEPDGYLDHFQLVHAGEDESAGGGAQGEDAIWAHRWYAYPDAIGRDGPEGNLSGGTEIGDTGLFVGDYTIQPENGGVGVFAHEFGHDLGLPDLYDTQGGENGTAFWTAMSSGSWLGLGDGTIGALPNALGAWEKLQLGWLDYDLARAATDSRHRLGPSAATYPEGERRDASQALIVELPDKTVTTDIHQPPQGEAQWWSGTGDGLDNTLTRTVDLSAADSEATLGLTGWWSIEEGYDYLYVEASADGGQTWTALDGTADGRALPRDGADRPALTGESGGDAGLVYPLTGYLGQQIQLRFHYRTDGSFSLPGFTADAITVTADGAPVYADDAESGPGDWAAEGFSVVGASITDDYPQFYLVENRQYTGFDATLERGPYHFGWLNERPDWVEHFPYQNGLLVWLWDTSQLDNDVSQHPGEGLVLPVDAHPQAERWPDGSVLRNRLQARDATFSTRPTGQLTLHLNGHATTLPSQRGAAAFDDHRGTYWDEDNPQGSVRVPDTHTRITLTDQPRDPNRPITIRISASGH
ncbi:immune inhibitor A domain-containing protein [Streptomyces hoynatensis]|uniref:immune inhibitor A domain-containing protein n=1 Tax=Streptomyces hoynatensis TaxID=1141874 RepID=UPI001F4EE8EF|nr:immune inhibitor A domain-containing protein [Streptomyces hoynatensis]